MIGVISNYVKGSLLIGIVCYLSSAFVMAVFFGFQFYFFGLIRLTRSAKFSLLHNAFLLACLWVLFEWIRGEIFSALPWLSYSMGVTMSRNLFLIQPAAIGGPWILSFVIIFASFFIAYAFQTKRWKLLSVPLALLLLHFGIGAWMHTNANENIETKNTFSIALIQPALLPETVWNDEHANELVSRLLTLNAEAARLKPDLIVWTETIVPWTYAPDDDFLKELISKTQIAKSHVLIGMNSVLNNDASVLCNSTYLLGPAGTKMACYDKQDLLALVEKPLFSADGNIILPFMAASGIKMRAGGNGKPMTTPWGKAGMLVCNEATSSSQAKDRVDNGANFLVNMGNDSWFAGSYISLQHFYNCRLRAVETRKDVVVNHNMGLTGVIRSDGEIASEFEGTTSGVHYAEVMPNNLPAKNISVFVLLILCITAFTIINRVRIQINNSNKQLNLKTNQ